MKTPTLLISLMIAFGLASIWAFGIYVRNHQVGHEAMREMRAAQKEGRPPPHREPIMVEVEGYHQLAGFIAVLALFGSALVTWTYRRERSILFRIACAASLLISGLALLISQLRT